MGDIVDDTLENIGASLRDARVNALLTQTDVGHMAGVSRQLVSRIEQGCNGEISAYVAVAAALKHDLTVVGQGTAIDNVPAGLDLFGGEESRTKKRAK